MKRLVILQIIGCLLYAAVVALLYILDAFSPVNAIILYVIMGLANIVNARIMLMKPIEDISTHDKLTDCYNRTMLEDKIREYEKHSEYTVIFFDVNNLKRINDIHGHTEGDKILIRAADQLRFWNKYGDLYRLGGDEFIVVVTNMTGEALEPIISSWYSKQPALNADNDDDFVCDLSYGISSKIGNDLISLKSIMDSADEKMYEMKKQIKNRDKTVR